METSIYLISKYWLKHKKNFFTLIFSGIILVALIFVVLMQYREICARAVNYWQDGQGGYDVIISNSNDEIFAKVTEGKSNFTYGYINVLGEIGTNTSRFYCGTLHDEENVYHLPLLEGRLPETSSEIAFDTNTKETLFWTGKCGDRIILDGETYTVTGIIDNNEIYRFGWQNQKMSNEVGHPLPPVFVGASDKTPIYRIDFFGDYYIDELLPDMDSGAKRLDGRETYESFLNELVGNDFNEHWVYCNYDKNNKRLADEQEDGSRDNTNFFIFIAFLGIIVAILSVYSVLKSVFSERAAWIETLRRIGAGHGAITKFYAVECAIFTIIQTIIGLILGLAAYGGIFAYKINALDEKPISGFSSHYIVTGNSRNPFFYAIIYSICVFVPAYLLCIITSKNKKEKIRKAKKPRSNSRCLGKIFARGSVTVVQTAALTLICFSTVLGYLFHTYSGKDEMGLYIGMPMQTNGYEAGGIDMKKEGVAEYYFCNTPNVTGVGHQDRSATQQFKVINPDDTRGFGEDTVAKLPEGTVSMGNMEYLFFTSEKPSMSYGDEIDLSDEAVKKLFLQMATEEYQNFFDEGQPGSKHMYQAPTRLLDARAITNKLADFVKEGEINIEKINAGEEILVAYQTTPPPFSPGEKITLYMSTANPEQGFGVGEIDSAEVTVAGVVKLPNDYSLIDVVACERDRKFTFLTTSAGARAMGAPSCTYSQAYAFEEIKGAPFPLSAEASVTSLKKLKREVFTNRMRTLGSILLILTTMSLLGFAAYFNGIGMKIRAKKYEISVLRAVGTPVSAIRKKLILSSLKIPLIASGISYGLIKIVQFITGKLGPWYIEMQSKVQNMSIDIRRQITNEMTVAEREVLYAEVNALADKMEFLRRVFFLDNFMWDANAEIPTLILFVILCAVTFILTFVALKKFKRDIAFDLNSGRARQ